MTKRKTLVTYSGPGADAGKRLGVKVAKNETKRKPKPPREWKSWLIISRDSGIVCFSNSRNEARRICYKQHGEKIIRVQITEVKP